MTRTSHPWMIKLRHYWPILPLALIMLLLVIPELDNMGYTPWSTDPCSLQEIDQGGFAGHYYPQIARWALRISPVPNVAIIYISPKSEPAEILTNTCSARAFLSRLVEELNKLHVTVIVIDKFYSKMSCTEDKPNAIFLDAMNKSVLPVVVGQPTHRLAAHRSQAVASLSPTLFHSARPRMSTTA
jgi:hypothetical protein